MDTRKRALQLRGFENLYRDLRIEVQGADLPVVAKKHIVSLFGQAGRWTRSMKHNSGIDFLDSGDRIDAALENILKAFTGAMLSFEAVREDLNDLEEEPTSGQIFDAFRKNGFIMRHASQSAAAYYGIDVAERLLSSWHDEVEGARAAMAKLLADARMEPV